MAAVALKETKVYEKPLDIEKFTDTLEVRFGCYKYSVFQRFSSPKNEIETLKKILGDKVDTSVLNLKGLFKSFSDIMGITPTTALRIMNKVGWSVLAEGYTNEQVFKYCYNRGYKRMMQRRHVESLHEIKPIIKQALADGQENLIPILLVEKTSVKELKDKLPRRVWKNLIRGSFTKNQIIAQHLELKSRNCPAEKYLGQLSEYRYGTLTTFNNLGRDIVPIIERVAIELRVLSKPEQYRLLANKIVDTIDMAKELGEPWNPEWKAKRWDEEHTRLSRLIFAKKHSDALITAGVYPKLPNNVVTPHGTATLLTSALEVAMEGNKMNHCVGSYSSRCVQGKYAVWHIVTTNGEESTLGCNISDSEVRFNQHYGYSNRLVRGESEQVRLAVLAECRKALKVEDMVY